MVITLTTSFRTIPGLSLQTWKDEFKRLASPLSAAEIEDCFHASQGWAVALDQAIGESSLRDSEPVKRNNLLNLMDENGFKSYPKDWMAFNEFMRRVYDPGYKSGVYYPGSLGVGGIVPGYDLSLAGYKVIYIGGPGCLQTRGATCANGETYDPAKPMLGESVVRDTTAPSINRSIAASMLRYDGWFDQVPPLPGPDPEPGTGEVVFGRVPSPRWTDRQIPDRLNHAWDSLGTRRYKGLVYHRMLGTLWGTDGWFRDPRAGGLTDFGVDHNTGELLEWNSYLGVGRSGISPHRSPHANGSWQNPPGDGRAFVNMFGLNAINRDLVSFEISGNYGDAISSAGRGKIVALSAYLADQAKIRWDSYPLNPHTGLIFTYWHNEFQAEKPCPGSVVQNLTPQIIAETQALMKKHQVN